MYRGGVNPWVKGSVQSLLCFEFCTPEGRGGEKGGSSNFKTKHTEPLMTQEICNKSLFGLMAPLRLSNK